MSHFTHCKSKQAGSAKQFVDLASLSIVYRFPQRRMFGLLRLQFVGALDRTMAYYAVAKGRKVGIYGDWAQCEEQVKGFKGAVYKKFKSQREAEQFINTKAVGIFTNYAPDEFAVPLGQKGPPAVGWIARTESKTSPEFWPEDVAEENGVTEDELVSRLQLNK